MNPSTNLVSDKNNSEVFAQANSLVQKFKEKLATSIQKVISESPYKSIDDVLEKKYNLTNIESMDFPSFKEKTEFITKSVRGNIQKADGNILSYPEAEKLIENALNEELL